MPGPPLCDDQQYEALLAAVRAEDLPITVDLDAAVYRVGWEGVVLDTADGWIIRFPRGTREEYRRELAVLDRLNGRLPVPTPVVVATGSRRDFAVYRRLDGATLDPERYAAAGRAEQDHVAASLARFLAAMHHALSAEEIAELGIPRWGSGGERREPPADWSEPLRRRWDGLQREFAARRAAGAHRAVLLHDDFHPGNFVLDRPLGRLGGVWDFSCVSVGDPSLEFRYLVGDSMMLAQQVASFYAARTGFEIDLGLAALALQIEDVCDAIEEGRDPVPALMR